jgi:DUF1680 family protein
MPIAVVAIGGNSLVRPGEHGTLEEQRTNLQVTCEACARDNSHPFASSGARRLLPTAYCPLPAPVVPCPR